uniref:IGFBP N-terminal domain-containing protein n=1 Tax=Erpetoichthys calabaricus TaxID=27687 RepID=A0A8C4X2T7_ERPCA
MYLGVKCVLITQLVILVAKNSRALVCLRCDESKCEEPKNCPGSVVLGICGCCSVCAKQKNESCGGVYGLHGTCDRGLRCVIRPPLNGDSITEYEVGVCEGTHSRCDESSLCMSTLCFLYSASLSRIFYFQSQGHHQ